MELNGDFGPPASLSVGAGGDSGGCSNLLISVVMILNDNSYCVEQGIRKICSELLELKDAIENLCGNMQSKYHAFLR